jgi:hypothetical protein
MGERTTAVGLNLRQWTALAELALCARTLIEKNPQNSQTFAAPHPPLNAGLSLLLGLLLRTQ